MWEFKIPKSFSPEKLTRKINEQEISSYQQMFIVNNVRITNVFKLSG